MIEGLKVGDRVTVLNTDGTKYSESVANYGYVESLHAKYANIVIEVYHFWKSTFYFPQPYAYERIQLGAPTRDHATPQQVSEAVERIRSKGLVV